MQSATATLVTGLCLLLLSGVVSAEPECNETLCMLDRHRNQSHHHHHHRNGSHTPHHDHSGMNGSHPHGNGSHPHPPHHHKNGSQPHGNGSHPRPLHHHRNGTHPDGNATQPYYPHPDENGTEPPYRHETDSEPDFPHITPDSGTSMNGHLRDHHMHRVRSSAAPSHHVTMEPHKKHQLMIPTTPMLIGLVAGVVILSGIALYVVLKKRRNMSGRPRGGSMGYRVVSGNASY